MATNIKSSLSKDEVKALQTALNQNYGAGLDVDGVFGAKTQAAVNNAYGDLGLKTWKNGGISQNGYDQILNKTTQTAQPQQSQYYDTLQQLTALVNQSAGQAPTYQSKWDPVAEKLSNAALNMNYTDFKNSPEYAQLASQYKDYGQQAMKDTLGQVAARTGGLASSYATSAGQQAYNNYLGKLNEAALNMYDVRRNDAIANAQLAIGNANNDYNRYQDELAAYNNNRNMTYNLLQDAIKQQQYEEEMALAKQQANQKATTSSSTAKGQDKSTGYNEVLAKVKKMDSDEVKPYVERLVDSGVITPEEADYLDTIYGEGETKSTKTVSGKLGYDVIDSMKLLGEIQKSRK